MNTYQLLKINKLVRNHRVKFLGLYLLHIFNKRYLAVNLDPIMACNLRCKMCYFSDKDYVKKIKGVLKEDEIEGIAKSIFNRALKLQIGCGTEPTLYKNLPKIVEYGKKYNVPYISLTTNANLLDESKIESLLVAGLNEFTISMHGVKKETYQEFMQKGDYDKFRNIFKILEKFKIKYNFKVRINYTFNKDNFYELKELFNFYNGKSFDILQLRPIENIGNTQYNNFDLSSLKEDYEPVLNIIKNNCKKNNITLLAPLKLSNKKGNNNSAILFKYTFCYVSPNSFWKEDFNWRDESFEEYTKRTRWGKELLQNVFKSKKQLTLPSKHLNYDVTI